MAQRNEYIDIVKGFGILLVVVGHCVQYGAGQAFFDQRAFYGNTLFKFIYSFHMPLFMLISGYLFGYAMKRPAKDIIWKKTKGILIPLVAFQTTFLLICHDHSMPLSVVPYTYLHALWFLRALFLFYMVVLFINRMLRDKTVYYVLLILATPFIHHRILPDVFAFTMPYFIIGYLFNKYQKAQMLTTLMAHNTIVWAISGLAFIVLLGCFEDHYYAYVSKSYLFNGKYPVSFMVFVNIYRHLTACAGCLFVFLSIWFVYGKFHHSLTTVLTELSKASLCIYSINYYLNDTLLLSLPVNHLDYFIVLAESVAITALGYATYWVMKQNKVTNTLFLGGR